MNCSTLRALDRYSVQEVTLKTIGDRVVAPNWRDHLPEPEATQLMLRIPPGTEGVLFFEPYEGGGVTSILWSNERVTSPFLLMRCGEQIDVVAV